MSESTYLGDGQVTKTKASEGAGPTLIDTIDATYDGLGRPDQLKRSTTVLADFGWNADGTLASRADGDAGVIGTTTFAYDWADRLTSANLPDGFSTAVPTFAWRADGLIKSRTFDAGSAVSFSYDRAKRPTTIAKGTLSLGQAYDRDSNVTSESRSLGFSGDAGSGTQTFTYDGLNRVLGSTGLGTGHEFTYEYDHDGNRTLKADGTTTWTYGFDRTDQLSSVNGGPTVVGYNQFGDMTSKPEDTGGSTAWTYDYGGKLTSINGPNTGDDASFTFDALGRFKTRVLAASTDTYSYLGTTETVIRIDSSLANADIDSIITSAGDRLGIDAGSTMNWLLPDPHGSVAASLSADENTVTNAIRYDAWGDTLVTGGAGGAVGADAWKYQARLDVSPSGLGEPLYDMSARFYSPSLGTFTQLDSVIGSAQNPLSMNRFLYAHANPATLIDPSGHKTCGPDGAWCTGTNADIVEVGNSGGTVTPPKKPKKAKHGPNPNVAKDAFEYVPPSEAFLRNLRGDDVAYNAFLRSYGAYMWSWLAQTRKLGYYGQLNAAAHIETLRAIQHFALNIWGNKRFDQYGHGVTSNLGNWISPEAAAENYETAEWSGDSGAVSTAIWAVMLVGAPWGQERARGPRLGTDLPVRGGRAGPVTPVRAESGCAHSFSPETVVQTTGGKVPIASLEIGDTVTAVDLDSGLVAEHTVTAVMVNSDPEIEYLRIDGDTIETTPNHPFLTDRGWVEAGALRPGTTVQKLDGTYGTVEGFLIEVRPVMMWDLTVSEVHTFAVGDGEWVVHNLCGVDPPMPTRPGERPPGEGWEWKGRGPEGSERGSWTKPGSQEYVRWDPNEKTWGAHWDWRDKFGNEWRIFPDGSARLK